ncbi:MAG: MBL fold metallo-hydrolase [Nitrososphaerales archaeon]
MASLTFYGGVGEIGGNCILVEDRDTRILLDFGVPFASRSRYYSPPYLSPRSINALLKLNLLPNIEGAYESDKMGRSIDAAVLTHAHMDHVGYIGFLKDSIPIYCGEAAATILNYLSEVTHPTIEFSVEGKKINRFRTGQKLKIGSVTLEPIHVDHSIPGAYGIIVYTSEGAVVYTGDLRRHGPLWRMTDDFVERAAACEPEVFICEATNMLGATVSSEEEVLNKLNTIVKESSGLIIADFSKTDVDRLRSFYTVAEKCGRTLTINLKQARLLWHLQKDPGIRLTDLGKVAVYRKRKKRYERWEQDVLNSMNCVDSEEVARRQRELILVSSFYDFEEFIDVEPEAGSCFILSASEPFNEEMEIDFERLSNWLNHLGLPHYHIHVSGHIMPTQLREVVKKVGAKKIYPIHTEHPHLFAKYVADVCEQTIPPEKGVKYSV